VSAVCFAASAKSEIKHAGRKLAGSAQRKMRNVILQHGSVLCGNYHTRIIEYLNISAEGRTKIADTMREKTTDIRSVLGSDTDYPRLEDSLVKGFEKYFGMKTEKFPEILLNAITA
jgi:lipoate-protein ligase A